MCSRYSFRTYIYLFSIITCCQNSQVINNTRIGLVVNDRRGLAERATLISTLHTRTNVRKSVSKIVNLSSIFNPISTVPTVAYKYIFFL